MRICTLFIGRKEKQTFFGKARAKVFRKSFDVLHPIGEGVMETETGQSMQGIL